MNTALKMLPSISPAITPDTPMQKGGKSDVCVREDAICEAESTINPILMIILILRTVP
jgi:hypothetical protein